MNPWAPELSNKLVFYENGRKTCVIDMNHSLKPLLICAGCLLVQLIQRGKLNADLIRRGQDKCFGQYITLSGGLQSSNGGISWSF